MRSSEIPVATAAAGVVARCASALRAALLALACVGAAGAALAQQPLPPQQQPSNDPPDRAAALGWREGAVSLLANGETAWSDAPIGRPLTAGDRLWAPVGSRAEVQLGVASLRLGGGTGLDIGAIGDQGARFTLNQGTAAVRSLASANANDGGDRVEIGTANLALVLDGAGEARLDVDPASGTTRVAVRSGRVTLFGQNGAAIVLGAGGEAALAGRDLAGAPMTARGNGSGDDFDAWVASRNRIEDQALAPRYLPRSVVGWQQLEGHGDWRVEQGYGEVWYPRAVAADWAPYRYGHWSWIAPWGWSWVDDAPWGFAPSHYGRWASVGGRWGWVPGRYAARPVYSPAVVAFIGNGGARSDRWRIGLADGGPGVAWIPLAPGEAWRPHFRHSDAYAHRANQNIDAADRFRIRGEHGPYAYQRVPGAVTAVPEGDFGRGRPFSPGRFHSVAPQELARAAAAPPPPLNRIAFDALTRPGGPRPPLPPEALSRPLAVESRGFGANGPNAGAVGNGAAFGDASRPSRAVPLSTLPGAPPLFPQGSGASGGNRAPIGAPAVRADRVERPFHGSLDRSDELGGPARAERPPAAANIGPAPGMPVPMATSPPVFRSVAPAVAVPSPATRIEPPVARSFEDRRGPRQRLEDAPAPMQPPMPPVPRAFVPPVAPAPAAAINAAPPLANIYRGAAPVAATEAPQRHPMLRPPMQQAAPMQGTPAQAPNPGAVLGNGREQGGNVGRQRGGFDPGANGGFERQIAR